MTRYAQNDETNTDEVLRQLDTDTTWLRHRGRAAELDRRLLVGASEAELAEVRADWRRHVAHLRGEHRLQVVEKPPGYWQLAASSEALSVNALSEEVARDDLAEGDDYEDGDVLASDTSTVTPERQYTRLRETARALAALAKEGLLGESVLKASVGMLIRQATESNHWHNCAHYRSKAAAALIEHQLWQEQGVVVTAFKYQSFCRANLRHEHVVPNSVIYEMLKGLECPSTDTIEALLRRFCIRATVTHDEDSKLRRAGLSSAMPAWFYDPNHSGFEQPLARYSEVELEKELVPLPSGLLWHQVPVA